MLGLETLHHATLAQVAMAATLFLIVISFIAWKANLLEPVLATTAEGSGNQELEVRFAVAKGYVRSCLGYIHALEEATQAMLDLKSSCWKSEEQREMRASHELLKERTMDTVKMFQRRGNAKAN